MSSEIPIINGLDIPAHELRFETGPSSGPGGQHVNKTETRVTLIFDVAASTSLDDDQRRTLQQVLGSRLNKEGELRLTSQTSRSQKVNREDTIDRFASLLREALTPKPRRKPTRIPPAAKTRRRAEKQKVADKKKQRRAPDWE